MPGPIDDALKHLTELSPEDWVVRGGWPAASAALLDADIGTISGATDKAIRVSGTPDWLLAIDFQSGHDSLAKLADLLLYNSALFKRHGVPVRTLLVLLHRGADSMSEVSPVSRLMRPCDTEFCASGKYRRWHGFLAVWGSFRSHCWAAYRKQICLRSWPR
jgi:hypothetical protein